IPNSEVKPLSADDSVAVCHAKVGNCQALKLKTQDNLLGFFLPVSLRLLLAAKVISCVALRPCGRYKQTKNSCKIKILLNAFCFYR
uniref:hypothetical protein n=1 Tax=Methylobacter psychrophilus TaxID=96941 RepID=UPI0021D4C19B